jgi:hypothetical protein
MTYLFRFWQYEIELAGRVVARFEPQGDEREESPVSIGQHAG